MKWHALLEKFFHRRFINIFCVPLPSRVQYFTTLQVDGMPLQRTLTRLNVMMLVRTNGPLYVQCRSEDIVLEFPYLIIESMLWAGKRAGIGNHSNFKRSHYPVKSFTIVLICLMHYIDNKINI